MHSTHANDTDEGDDEVHEKSNDDESEERDDVLQENSV